MEEDNIFTIIVTCYNNQKLIYSCLESIIKQSYNAIEIIISDDCSRDFNRKETEEFINSHSDKNIIKYVINQNSENIGIVKNVNTAIKLSTGEYIMILACDDMLYDNDVVCDIVKYFQSENCQGVVGFIEIYDYEMQEIKAVFPRRKNLEYVNTHTPIEIFNKLCESVMLPGPGFTFKKEVIDKYGLYDEEYILTDDYPRYLYLTRNGCIIKFIDRKLIKYRQGGITSNKYDTNIKNIIKQDLKLVRKKEISPYIKR